MHSCVCVCVCECGVGVCVHVCVVARVLFHVCSHMCALMCVCVCVCARSAIAVLSCVLPLYACALSYLCWHPVISDMLSCVSSHMICVCSLMCALECGSWLICLSLLLLSTLWVSCRDHLFYYFLAGEICRNILQVIQLFPANSQVAAAERAERRLNSQLQDTVSCMKDPCCYLVMRDPSAIPNYQVLSCLSKVTAMTRLQTP